SSTPTCRPSTRFSSRESGGVGPRAGGSARGYARPGCPGRRRPLWQLWITGLEREVDHELEPRRLRPVGAPRPGKTRPPDADGDLPDPDAAVFLAVGAHRDARPEAKGQGRDEGPREGEHGQRHVERHGIRSYW